MTCRHDSGDPNCSSSKQKSRLKEPDNSQFEIIDCLELPGGLLLRIKYEDCVKCSYEGTKVLVYSGATTKDIFKWKVIDPHFSDKPHGPREAPSPTARFPGSATGWEMARRFLVGLDTGRVEA